MTTKVSDDGEVEGDITDGNEKCNGAKDERKREEKSREDSQCIGTTTWSDGSETVS